MWLPRTPKPELLPSDEDVIPSSCHCLSSASPWPLAHTWVMALTPELEAMFFRKFCHCLLYGIYPDEEE